MPAAELPQPPVFTPSWLSPEDVKSWLRLHVQDTGDDAEIQRICAVSELYVQRCRPEFATTTGFKPDAEAYHGGVMYAAREYRRRNSPAGIEMFGEVSSFVARYDADIDRALHTGPFAPPIIA